MNFAYQAISHYIVKALFKKSNKEPHIQRASYQQHQHTHDGCYKIYLSQDECGNKCPIELTFLTQDLDRNE